jgi:hypothetical protein
MSRDVAIGSLVLDHFPVLEDDGITKHSGLLSGSFTALVYRDSVPTAIPVTIAEIGTSGEYTYSFTPATVGVYDVEISIAYNSDLLLEQFIAKDFAADMEAQALADADAVWDETLSAHLTAGSTGAALANLSALMTGAKQITIRLRDPLVVAIQGAQIDVYDALNIGFLGRVYTPVSGNVNVALDPGTYNLRIFKTGWTFTVPIVLTVTVDAVVTYTGTTVIVITPPSAPNLCVVYGTIRNAGGIPVANAQVQAYSVTPQTVSGVIEGDPIACTVTDANGFFELELERNAQVNLLILRAGLDVIRTVPNLPTQDIVTWT